MVVVDSRTRSGLKKLLFHLTGQEPRNKTETLYLGSMFSALITEGKKRNLVCGCGRKLPVKQT